MKQEFLIAVISLESQTTRRQKIQGELHKSGCEWQFISAIPGGSLSFENQHYDQDQRIKMLGYDMKINEIACFLSHRKAWELCIKERKPALILEDDVIFTDALINKLDTAETINKICKILSKNIIIRLGNSHLSTASNELIQINDNLQLVRYKTNPSSAFSYLISPDAAESLILHSEKFFTPVDDFMWRGWEHNCHLADIMPDLILTSDIDNPSDIGDRKKPPMTIRKKIRREINQSLERIQRKRYEKSALKNMIKIISP